jgi:DnaK suppressor protein
MEKQMTKPQITFFRQQLLGLGQELQRDVGSLVDEVFCDTGVEANGDLSRVPEEYPTDRASGTYDEEAAISLLQQEGPREGEIRAALRRIDDGTFGRCESCGHEISHNRLEAIPFARQCIDCARTTPRIDD